MLFRMPLRLLERAGAHSWLRSVSLPIGLGGAAAATPSPIVGRTAAVVFTNEPHRDRCHRLVLSASVLSH